MTTYLQHHALRLYDSVKRFKDPLGALLPLVATMPDAHSLAPVVAAIRLIKPNAWIPKSPMFDQALAIIAADAARGVELCASEGIEMTDWGAVGMTKETMSQMTQYRKDNPTMGAGLRRIKEFVSDAHNDDTKYM